MSATNMNAKAGAASQSASGLDKTSGPDKTLNTAKAAVQSSHRRKERFRRLVLNRPDIQGLRAIAVSMVLLYHLFPQVFPGGFVGVDVFFVISGFLIVGSLTKQAATTGTIKWRSFYARRFRRLTPAASVVLIATLIAGLLILPPTRWQDLGRDTIASVLQVQNWNQIFTATGYQQAGLSVSPLQQFWTLSVEEQFYFVIPWLLLLGVFCAARFKRSSTTRWAFGLIALTSLASLLFSLYFSYTNHDAAYFSTFTRAWELGMGGLAAMAIGKVKLTTRSASVGGWLGLVMILASIWLLNTSQPIPGFYVLLPTLGAVLLIFCGLFTQALRSSGPQHASWWLCHRPFVFVGDISYSLYLWHWPIIVYCAVLTQQSMNIGWALLAVALSVFLAWVTYLWVELPLRRGRQVVIARGWHMRRKVEDYRAFMMAGSLSVVIVALALSPMVAIRTEVDRDLATSANVSLGQNPGAQIIDGINSRSAALKDQSTAIRPGFTAAKEDLSKIYRDHCSLNAGDGKGQSCVYGNLKGSKDLVLVGDSHAAQLLEGIDKAAQGTDWKITTMVFDGCPFSMSPPINADGPLDVCVQRNVERLDAIQKLKPQAVVVAGMTPRGYQDALSWKWKSPQDAVDGYVRALKPLVDAKISVSVVLDTPYPSIQVPDCLIRNGGDTSKCQITYDKNYLKNDPLSVAADQLPGVRKVDLTQYFCQAGTCSPVIGSVVVYRDNHITATYSKTLASALGKALGIESSSPTALAQR